MDADTLDTIWRTETGCWDEKVDTKGLIADVAKQIKSEIGQIEMEEQFNLQGMNGSIQKRFDEMWKRFGVVDR